MFRARFALVSIFLFSLTAVGSAQSSASCNLDNGSQVRLTYNPVSAKSEKISNGKPWSPGGAPMLLFTETQLSFGGATIPIGAYTVYPIPGKEWTLVVNKNVTAGAAYDEKQDLARAPMETDQVSQPSDSLEVAFAHTGEKCTLRIYFGKAASFAPFTAK
jgi:Protein of unknown function (DUF2911)